MRTLSLFTTTLVAVLGLSMAAQAATLTMTADKATYNVGETITLTVIGNSEGGTDTAIFGTVVYDALVSPNGGQTQNQLTSFGGFISWVTGVLQVDNPNVGTQDSFNQLGGTSATPVDQALTAVMTFTADAAGVTNFSWLTDGSFESLDFFGLTSAAGTSVTITAIPEPTTASMLGLGLVGLTVAGRRRKS